MKKNWAWLVAAMLILGLALLAVSCGGTTSAPAEEPAVEEPAADEPAAEGPLAITHPLDGRADCLMCHETGIAGAATIPADHSGRANETCTACHTPAA